jgi:hypothetical protein
MASLLVAQCIFSAVTNSFTLYSAHCITSLDLCKRPAINCLRSLACVLHGWASLPSRPVVSYSHGSPAAPKYPVQEVRREEQQAELSLTCQDVIAGRRTGYPAPLVGTSDFTEPSPGSKGHNQSSSCVRYRGTPRGVLPSTP